MSPLPISLFALLSMVACAPVTSSGAPPGAVEGHAGDDAAGEPPHQGQIRVAPGLEDNPCRAEAAQRFIGQQADRAAVQAAVAASGAARRSGWRAGQTWGHASTRSAARACSSLVTATANTEN